MPKATPSIRVEKRVIQLFEIMDTDNNIADYYKNANELLYSPYEHGSKIKENLTKMRTLFKSGK